MRDLNSLFRPGVTAGLQSNSVFTNRVGEIDEFRRSLRDVRRSAAAAEPGNLDLPRENILNFFGMGGIGKSTLSRRLERDVREDADRPRSSLRLDLEEPGSFDMEGVVLRLRAAAGHLGVPLVAFDIGLAHYWQRMHPGEEMATFIARNGTLRRAAEKIGVSEQVTEAVKEVASALDGSSTIAGLGMKSVQVIVSAIRRGRNLRHAIGGCQFLAPLLEADVDADYLSYLPALLAWDLSNGPPAEFVVFVDTYEKLDRRQVHVEKFVQRMIFLLPQVLFVVTGRNRLDWIDDRRLGELDYVGERFWPRVLQHTRGGTRCFLVGGLSDTDADRYLSERVTSGGAAAIPDDVRERIVGAAHGHPLYLDLAASKFVGAAGGSSPMRAEDFGEPFPVLVARMMSDLEPEQRSVLRGVSLLGAFDRDLARAAGGRVSDGSVSRLLARSFVTDDPARVLRYSIHPTLREALVEGSAIESDAWSDEDWRESALRLYRALGSRLENGPPREMLVEVCHRGLDLCDRFSFPLDWVGDAAEALYGLGVPVAFESSEAFRPGSAARDMTKVVEVMRSRGQSPVRQSLNDLGTVRAGGLLPRRTEAWVDVVRSDCAMDLGDYATAEAGYRSVLAGPCSQRMSNNALVALRLLLSKAGRFREALDLVSVEPFDNLRIQAGLHLYNAQWEEAEQCWRDALRLATGWNHDGLVVLCGTGIVIVDGWMRAGDGGRARAAASAALDAGSGWGYPASLAAAALATAGIDSAGSAGARDRSRVEAQRRDLHDNVFDVLLADAFDAAARGDLPRLDGVRQSLESEVRRDGAHPQWLQVVRWWSGGAEVGDDDIQWFGGAAAARGRWMETLELRRRQMAG